jgi:hypothetical protein
MPARFQIGSTLSVHNAFVVHFSTTGRPGRRRFTGRVEHLSSGQTTRFASLKELLAFFSGILEASQPESHQGP